MFTVDDGMVRAAVELAAVNDETAALAAIHLASPPALFSR